MLPPDLQQLSSHQTWGPSSRSHQLHVNLWGRQARRPVSFVCHSGDKHRTTHGSEVQWPSRYLLFNQSISHQSSNQPSIHQPSIHQPSANPPSATHQSISQQSISNQPSVIHQSSITVGLGRLPARGSTPRRAARALPPLPRHQSCNAARRAGPYLRGLSRQHSVLLVESPRILRFQSFCACVEVKGERIQTSPPDARTQASRWRRVRRSGQFSACSSGQCRLGTIAVSQDWHCLV